MWWNNLSSMGRLCGTTEIFNFCLQPSTFAWHDHLKYNKISPGEKDSKVSTIKIKINISCQCLVTFICLNSWLWNKYEVLTVHPASLLHPIWSWKETTNIICYWWSAALAPLQLLEYLFWKNTDIIPIWIRFLKGKKCNKWFSPLKQRDKEK